MSGLARMRGVEMFASGNHRGRDWTHADIDAIVRNFQRFSAGETPAHEVPGVFGHEEKDYSERTDLPAAGWLRRLWKSVEPCRVCRGGGCKQCFGSGERAVLKGDVDGIPPDAQKQLETGAYRHPSIEVYDGPDKAGLHGEGPMARRVAFLGAEPPQVKGLAPLPGLEKYSERLRRLWPTSIQITEVRRTKAGTWISFSEAVPMDRQAMLEKLKAAGVDVSQVTDATPDALLAEMCRLAEGGPAADADPDAAMDAADPATLDPAKKKEFAERCKRMGEKWAGRAKRFGEDMGTVPGSTEGLVDDKGKTMTPDKFSEAVKPLVDAAVKAAVARVEAGFKPIRERVESFESNTKKADIDKFCEAQVRAGKVLPAELDAGPDGKRPTLKDRLYRADAKAVVHRFAEKGKAVELTELDLQMREIESRPTLLRFGERTVKGGATTGADAEKAKVKQHYESFAEDFRKMGTTEEDLTKAFEARRKGDPELTAEKFLGKKNVV